MPEFTATEKRMLHILSDGLAHFRHELRDCLNDPEGDDSGVDNMIIVHICNIRNKLELMGQTIISEWDHKRSKYRHVRLLHSHGEG